MMMAAPAQMGRTELIKVMLMLVATKEKQGHGAEGEERRDNVHDFAGHAVQMIRHEVNADVLVMIEGFNGTEEGDVDEQEAGPFFGRREAGTENISQEGIVGHETYHAEENNSAEKLEKEGGSGFLRLAAAGRLLRLRGGSGLLCVGIGHRGTSSWEKGT